VVGRQVKKKNGGRGLQGEQRTRAKWKMTDQYPGTEKTKRLLQERGALGNQKGGASEYRRSIKRVGGGVRRKERGQNLRAGKRTREAKKGAVKGAKPRSAWKGRYEASARGPFGKMEEKSIRGEKRG